MLGKASLQMLSKTAAVCGARNMSCISGPPTVRISVAEKFIQGIVMTTAMLAYPAYVLVNIRSYRGMA